jgi:acetylornithine deacetylase/succinyl-diaminopimelate desuccinylase-like protein
MEGKPMDDLVTWLRVQLDEDERVAREVPPNFDLFDGTGIVVMKTHDPARSRSVTLPSSVAVFAVRHNPARALREVEAKRRILDEIVPLIDQLDAKIEEEWGNGPYPTGESDRLVKLLAMPYAGRPGYRDEWRPEGA